MQRFSAACLTLAIGFLSAMSAGCFPRQLIIWSPDATRAVVMDANSTSLCHGDGKLARSRPGLTAAQA